MKNLANDQIFRLPNPPLILGGLTLADTKYEQEFVDWHYHENPHFTLITRGDIRQGTRQEMYECPVNTVLFHNRQEPHYNMKSEGAAHGFQVEIHSQWSEAFGLPLDLLPNCAKIKHPDIQLRFHHIYKETKLFDDVSALTIDALLLEMFSSLRHTTVVKQRLTPEWVKKIDDLLHDHFDQPLSLQSIATELDLHWAHLSRDFPRYFHCTFGAYIRKIRVEKSLSMLRDPQLSLTNIALQCGFSDQSHYNRCFKEFIGVTPKAFRKITD